tara:strand:- start:316 stop:1080 length:765 start_codon:yes stop_codon:yes gene_type:complete
MLKKFVVANWKMNLDVLSAKTLVLHILKKLSKANNINVQKVFCVPYVFIDLVREIIKETRSVYVGVQNCSDKSQGSYTGEISTKMLRSCGVEFVILGHSERRLFYHETDEIIAKKLSQSIRYSLRPIFCCGEPTDQREKKNHLKYVARQIKTGLYHLNPTEINQILIAYEPIWAIGTGNTANLDDIEEMHQFIRKEIQTKYGRAVSKKIPILYGGSINTNNAEKIFNSPNINGGLIGGSSLKANDFLDIINFCN